VLLEDVKTLTLQKGQRTQARRVSAVPQLKCIGGSAKCAYEPDVVQCYNRGSNGVDIQVRLFILNSKNYLNFLVGMYS